MDSRLLQKYYKGKNMLLVGGAGFIGSSLAKELIKHKANCAIVDPFLKFCGANTFNIKEIIGDVKLYKQPIEDFIASNDIEAYDIIFNCAGLTDHFLGMTDPGLDYEINCLSGLKLLRGLESCKKMPKLISIGSRTQYGKTTERLVDENYPMRPLDVQSIHKVTLEHYQDIYARKFGLDTVFLRLTNVYGPGQRLRGNNVGFMGEIIRNALQGTTIMIYGSSQRTKDILFIDDVINALVLLGMQKKHAFKVYNLGGQPCTMSDIAEIIKNIFPQAVIKFKPFVGKIKNIGSDGFVLNVSEIKKDVGWMPSVGIDDGLSETFDFYKRHKKHYL